MDHLTNLHFRCYWLTDRDEEVLNGKATTGEGVYRKSMQNGWAQFPQQRAVWIFATPPAVVYCLYGCGGLASSYTFTPPCAY